MKRILTYIFLFALSLSSFAGDDVVLFFLNDGSIKAFYKDEVDSIVYSHYDTDSIYHNNVVVQDVWSNDSVSRIPVQMIDSIRYSMPEPVYKPGVIKLDERYLPYITSADGLALTISPNIPDYLRPKEGDVLLYAGSSDLFPDGFVGKVSSFSGETLVCDTAKIDDVYESVVFMGRYAISEVKTENGVKYHAKSLRHKTEAETETGGETGGETDGQTGTETAAQDEGWGYVIEHGFNLPNFKIKKGAKIEFNTDIGKFTVASYTETTFTIFVEFRYSCNFYEPVLFNKMTVNTTTEQAAKLQYCFVDIKPAEEDEVFEGKDVKWFTYSVSPEKNNGKTILKKKIINCSVPVPECPLLSLGWNFGFFMEPEVKGTLSYKFTTKTTTDYTVSYHLNKRNWDLLNPGSLISSKTVHEPTYQNVIEGDVSGSVWFGLVLGGNIGFGEDVLKENVDLKIGPYIELDANLNISDGVVDKSWYSALKDTKLTVGLKMGISADLTAKAFGKKAKWDQFDLDIPKLFFRKERYLFPEFSKPTYTKYDDVLICDCNLSRLTYPNLVGFRLYDETGESVTKYQVADYADTSERAIRETFTGLDFTRHRYRIAPVTAIFKSLTVEIPDPSQTWALCPDSNHPHLIDMGLDSGTKWSCCNLFADEPLDAGGYYQWGAPLMQTSCSSPYTMPSFSGYDYQGQENDAATANLGADYVTPKVLQFKELLSSSMLTVDESTWGTEDEGLFLKARSNGADLYLPFAGYRDGTAATGTDYGYYIISDKADGAADYPVYMIGEDATGQSIPADYYGYSVRPVSAPVPPEVPTCSFDVEQFETNVGKTYTIALNTNSNGIVTYTSSNPDVAEVDAYSGMVTALKAGSTVITANVAQTSRFYASSASYSVIVEEAKETPAFSFDVEQYKMKVGQTYTRTATTSSDGKVTYSSSNPDVATVDAVTGLVIALKAGIAVITVDVAKTDTYYDCSASYTITVESAPNTTGKHNGHEYVDLGLSVMWATCNVGASSIEDYGDYFACGETTGYNGGKTTYSWSTYKYCNGMDSTMTKYCTNSDFGTVDNKTVLEPEDDAAHVYMGGSWRIPTNEELVELLDKCEWNWYTQNGVSGMLVTGPNGNSIFLPAAGIRDKGLFHYRGSTGIYSTSSISPDCPDCVYFVEFFPVSSDDVFTIHAYTNRYYGMSLRAVYDTLKCTFNTMKRVMIVGESFTQTVSTNSSGRVTYSSSNPDVASVDAATGKVTALKAGSTVITASLESDELYQAYTVSYSVTVEDVPGGEGVLNGHVYVDLGLSVKWAACNVGAGNPEDYGNYISWGETTGYDEGKTRFYWSDYSLRDDTSFALYKYCTDSSAGTLDNLTTLEPADDAATANWGIDWRMPTTSEWKELHENCTWTWTTLNDTDGYTVTGTNGNSIFLPAAGQRFNDVLSSLGKYGWYWSSSLDSKSSLNADVFDFNSGHIEEYNQYRYYGLSVRPVCP